MTTDEAHTAARHAFDIIDGCMSETDNIAALDAASDYDTAIRNCPSKFLAEQRDLVQRLLLDAYMRVIGRM